MMGFVIFPPSVKSISLKIRQSLPMAGYFGIQIRLRIGTLQRHSISAFMDYIHISLIMSCTLTYRYFHNLALNYDNHHLFELFFPLPNAFLSLWFRLSTPSFSLPLSAFLCVLQISLRAPIRGPSAYCHLRGYPVYSPWHAICTLFPGRDRPCFGPIFSR